MFNNKKEIIAHTPTRMCVVCRKRDSKNNFIRVVKNKRGDIFIDKSFKAQGRGAYICKNKDCLLFLKKNKGFNRSFKCEISDELYQALKGEIETLD